MQKHHGLSITVGIVTPAVCVALAWLVTGGVDGWVPGTMPLLLLAAMFLLLGTALLPGIAVGPYVTSAAVGAPAMLLVYAMPGILRDPTSNNLLGLVMMMAFLAAGVAAVPMLLVYVICQRLRFPSWAAAVPFALCLLVCVVVSLRSETVSAASASAALRRMEQIRDAQRLYAARQPNSAVACDGRKLPGVGEMNWHPNAAHRGTMALDNHYWFELDCSAGSLELRAYPAWGRGNGGPRYFLRPDGTIGITPAIR